MNKRKKEIGDKAIWSLSSAKTGNGILQLRDDNLDTYWQSDGVQPHLINIQFHEKVSLVDISIYVDYKLDESYTPKTISIRSGTTYQDLTQVQIIELHEPKGWITIPLGSIYSSILQINNTNDENDKYVLNKKNKNNKNTTLRAHLFQIAILTMHQNGRDTHIRQIKVNSYYEESFLLYNCFNKNKNNNIIQNEVDTDDDDIILEPTSIHLTKFSCLR